MNIQNWKVFNKEGSPLNWSPDPLIPLIISSPTGTGAQGFLITNPSGNVVDSAITNGGYLYDNNDITLSYKYALDTTSHILTPAEASIFFVDVSIFNPTGINTQSISSLNLNIDASFIYPSATYAAAIFLNPISQGLVETENLFILEETSTGYIRPHDNVNNVLVMEFIGDENQIQFFEVDENTSQISWADVVVFDLSTLIYSTPLQVNIGFRSDVEGVFERILRIYHLVGNNLYTLGDVVVGAEAIGEDERFRTLLSNFGLPDPVTIQQVFKETDINEDLPDWKVLNQKSKHMILEHDKIMPFVGTYKGLINAIKWLGYDDIYLREWFLNVKENTKLSLIVPYDAKDRTQTILSFNADQRKVLKKLNQLSLNYCITKETGALDEWGTPITEDCYSYNLKEVYIKLLSLKKWLEQNIIGVNCKITDITGEGIYFERIQNLIYETDNLSYNYTLSQTLTPYGPDENTELIGGDASVRLTFLELTQSTVGSFPFSFLDTVEYAWKPTDPSKYYSLDDPIYLANPSSFVLIGPTFEYPFTNIHDIMWRLSQETESGVLDKTLVSNPILIIDDDIRYYNPYDSSSIFYDVSTSLTIYLEKAFLRNANNYEWEKSIDYSIYPNPSANGYIMESSLGVISLFNDYITLNPGTNSLLQYAVDNNYNVPLLSFKNYTYLDSTENLNSFIADKFYNLDILDGKIEINAGIPNPSNSSDNLIAYVNWNYDTSLDQQMITYNPVYTSPRMKLFQIDPSAYYWADPSGLTGGNNPNVYLQDNSIYSMNVNHIGNYNIELFAWDAYNSIFYNTGKTLYPVWMKAPTTYFLVDNSSFMDYDASKYMSYVDVNKVVLNNLYPIYDRYIPLDGLTLLRDMEGNPYINVPSITYFQELPLPNSTNLLFNLTEKVLNIAGLNITIQPYYQSFNTNDDVTLVKFDKGKFSLVAEASSHVISSIGNTLTLDNIPSTIFQDSSSSIYILNDTYRNTANPMNINNNLHLDVSNYMFSDNQLVGIVVTDNCTGYSWGASYRVIDTSGFTHIFDKYFPQYFIDNSTRYKIQAKHAFSTFAEFILNTSVAYEINNNFNIYFENSYCQENYLDNTFVYMNILFDHSRINSLWYNPSLNLINSDFYYYQNYIDVDLSTLVILRAEYDSSTYMIGQRNIWTATDLNTGDIFFKVYNDSVPILFGDVTNYDINVRSYDIYGNLIKAE